MQEAIGNLWHFYSFSKSSFACITTNGFRKKNGRCVMGRGCAKEARDTFKNFDLRLGEMIEKHGNHVFIFPDIRLVTFPTKHNWWESSDTDLISASAKDLAQLAKINPDNTFYLPRPGCKNGGLNWKDVKPRIENILPDNVIAITNEP